MKRPVPPSNFRSRDNDTREDLRRLREGFQELLDWIDANRSEGGGGEVDLSDYDTIVGNDTRYLKRTDNDWTGFSAGSVALGDKVLIERASDGAKRTLTVADLRVLLGQRDEMWDPPFAASADDDEFTTDTLASGVWQIFADTDPVTTAFTRAGDVDVTATLSANTYRSTLKGSALLVQIPAAVGVIMVKRLAANLDGTKQWWWAGVGAFGAYSNAVTSNFGFGIQLWKATGAPKPDQQNRYVIRQTSGGAGDAINMAARTANVVNVNDSYGMTQLLGNAQFGLHTKHAAGGDRARGFIWTRGGTVQQVQGNTAVLAAVQQGYVGFPFSTNTSWLTDTVLGSPVFIFHFLRRREAIGSNWLIAP